MFFSRLIQIQSKFLYQKKMEIICPKEQVIHISPNKYLAELGNSCMICKSKVKYYESISVCYCYMFTHRQCFLEKIKDHIKPKRKFVCLYCGHQMQISSTISHKINWRFDSRQLFAFIICILALILTVVLTKMGLYRVFFPDIVLYAIVVVLFVLLMLAILNSLLVTEIDHLDIKATKLEKKLAKVDIDFVEERSEQEQETNVQMLIPESKKCQYDIQNAKQSF